jgi:hypothetical protein
MNKARIKFARLLGFDIPQLSAQIERAKVEAARLQDRFITLENEIARLRAPQVTSPVASESSAKISAAKRLRDLLITLLDRYDLTNGISCDAYCDTPQWHAMAEAQYLEAVVIAHGSGLLSDAQARKRVGAGIARLQAGALQRQPGVFAQWGLGFRWQELPADEPFLVTTALVTRALMAANGLAECADLAREGLQGLARLPQRNVVIEGKNVPLPVYSPNLPEVVDNALAVWAQVVLGSRNLFEPSVEAMHHATLALKWLESRFLPGLGWAYSTRRPIIDLIHQVYIIEALHVDATACDLELRAIETFAAFRAGEQFIDSMAISSCSAALEAAERSGGHYAMFRGDQVLTASIKPARLWSMGAMLGSFGIFAREGKRRGYWLSQIRRFPLQMLPDRFGADFRQEMHLARGLALAVAALRESKAPDTQKPE